MAVEVEVDWRFIILNWEGRERQADLGLRNKRSLVCLSQLDRIYNSDKQDHKLVYRTARQWGKLEKSAETLKKNPSVIIYLLGV